MPRPFPTQLLFNVMQRRQKLLGILQCMHLYAAIQKLRLLRNSKEESLRRVQELTGKPIIFYQADVTDEAAVEKIFTEQQIDGVIHFAGLKAVGESVEQPVRYY